MFQARSVVERELLLTGIGGQGIQLAAQVIARGALSDGRAVQMFGSYGGMMRGGRTDATIVVADDAVAAPPTISSAWAAIVMHRAYAEPILASIRPGGFVLVSTEVGDAGLDRDRLVVAEVDSSGIAERAGNRMAGSMVMAGAFAAATDLVSLESLCVAVAESLPPYRRQLAEVNVAAIRAGFDAVPRGLAPAWEPDAQTVPR
jgi:Pyruvate/2-oxoacid:ferredoxin oxidoreductase gamma subunit